MTVRPTGTRQRLSAQRERKSVVPDGAVFVPEKAIRKLWLSTKSTFPAHDFRDFVFSYDSCLTGDVRQRLFRLLPII
jgi:hypothetical protein